MRARLLLAVLLAIVGLIAILQYDGSESRPSAQPQSTISQTRLPDELAALPPEALETIALIQDDGPFPHRQDGAVFMNRERRLPIHERGYWREYTVPTPGESDRGARRIVHGAGDEYYYTDDHYASFERLRVPEPVSR